MRGFLILLVLPGLLLARKHEDPECKMTTPQIIEHWGYPAQVFQVTTEDGYILELHRIPFGKSNMNSNRPVIFMQHGLECSSSNWITNLPDESAGFLFADAGFDVWLGNMRGNTYSNKHIKYKERQDAFWKFSWDEMSKYDLESMINFVLNATGKDSLYYMGHSQGTLTMFAKLSEEPSFSQKIKKFFALAPVGSVKHIKGMLKFLADNFSLEVDAWFDIFGAGEFLPNNIIMKTVATAICGGLSIENDMCDDMLFLIAGPESTQLNQTRVPVYLTHTPAGTSSQNVQHWLQMVKKGTVSMYDRGKKENEKYYGQPEPPEYDFTKINNPIYFYWGSDDWLADPTDIQTYLLPRINDTIVENHFLLQYNHLDFIWGLRAAGDIYNPIISMLKKENNMP